MRRIAFLLHHQHNTATGGFFCNQVLRGAREACRNKGILLLFMVAGPAEDVTEKLRANACDGVICAGFFEPELLKPLRDTGKPIVLVDMKLRGYSSVNPDNQMGGISSDQASD